MNPFPLILAAFRRSRLSALVFVAVIALTVALGIAISAQERALRKGSGEAAAGFDLIVAAPGSQTDTLLSVVYLKPKAGGLLAPPVLAELLAEPRAEFVAPIGFGDSYRGDQVVGTTADLVAHLGGGLAEGRIFASRNEAVVGALSPVPLGARIEIAHGDSDEAGDADLAVAQSGDHGGGATHAEQDADHAAHDHDHDHADGEAAPEADGNAGVHDPEQAATADHAGAAGTADAPDAPDAWQEPGHAAAVGHEPAEADHADSHLHLHEAVTVTGRLRPTGTPWDRAIIVPIEYTWFAHSLPLGHPDADEGRIGPPFSAADLPGVPAVVIRPETYAAAYALRSAYRAEGSTAFFPAEVLVELYAILGDAARIMAVLTQVAQILVVVAILAGLLAVLDLQRQRFAVLRALGAPGRYVFLTVWLYIWLLVMAGTLLGLPLGLGVAQAVSGAITAQTGIAMAPSLHLPELRLVGQVIGLSLLLALVPAAQIYRRPVVETLR